MNDEARARGFGCPRSAFTLPTASRAKNQIRKPMVIVILDDTPGRDLYPGEINGLDLSGGSPREKSSESAMG